MLTLVAPATHPLLPHRAPRPHRAPTPHSTPPPPQVTDDAQAQAKASKLRQAIQPYEARTAAVADWCDGQTPDSIAAFAAAHALVLPPAASPPAVAPAEGGAPAGGGDPAWPYRGRYTLRPLHDVFGDTVTDAGYTAIVCSEETLPGCALINARRVEGGMAPLEVIVARIVRGEGGAKLSSTDIRAQLAAREAAAGGGRGNDGERGLR